MPEASILFPQREECILSSSNTFDFINFKSLKKLKYFEGNEGYFLMLGDTELEKLVIDTYEELNIKYTIDKIISIKTLKNLYLLISSNYLSKYDFNKINNKNYSIIDLKFQIQGSFEHNNILINFLNTFPNIKNINIETSNALEYVTQSNYRIIQSVISHAVNPETFWRIDTINSILQGMKKEIMEIDSEKNLLDYTNEYLEILEKFIKDKSNDELREQLLEKIIDIERLDIDNIPKYSLNIIENKNCKIEKIKLLYIGNNFNINWQPFENIKEINLEIWAPLINIDAFPFFKNNNNSYKLLEYFRFEYFMEKINIDLI